jgi:hypothetical protein
MRFSIRWALAGVAYAAVSAAAFATGHWAYAAVMWAAAFLAIAYALPLAIFARGRRQGAATGFAIGALLLALCVQFAQGTVPTGRIVAAAFPPQVMPIPAASPYYAPPLPATVAAGNPSLVVQPAAPVPAYAPAPMAAPSRAWTAYPTPTLAINSYDYEEQLAARNRAANALAVMIAGLAGSLLGVAAYRRGQVDEAPAPGSVTGQSQGSTAPDRSFV